MGILADRVVAFLRETGVEAGSEALEISKETAEQWLSGRKTPSLRAAERVFQVQHREVGWQEVASAIESEPPPHTGFEVNLGGSKLALLLPWYRSANPFTALSVLGMFDRKQMRCLMAHGDAFISHTRNRLAQLFLGTECEWGLMVDDDMVLPWGKPAWFKEATGFLRMPDSMAGLNTIQRLLSHGKTLVGALYMGKNFDDIRPMYAEGCSIRETRDATVNGTAERGCIPTKWVATGCLLIHRRVFEDISKKYPHLDGGWFSPSEHDLVNGVDSAMKALQLPGDQSARLMNALTILAECKARAEAVSKLGTGEDVIFSLRAAAAGHIPHVDTGLVLGHVGNYVFGPKWVK
jgi:hypothetical protein